MHKRVGSNPPYAAMFSTSNNKIIFIAAEHTSDLNSKTFELIRASITNFKPELVIYEGAESRLGYSSKDMVDYIEKIVIIKAMYILKSIKSSENEFSVS